MLCLGGGGGRGALWLVICLGVGIEWIWMCLIYCMHSIQSNWCGWVELRWK